MSDYPGMELSEAPSNIVPNSNLEETGINPYAKEGEVPDEEKQDGGTELTEQEKYDKSIADIFRKEFPNAFVEVGDDTDEKKYLLSGMSILPTRDLANYLARYPSIPEDLKPESKVLFEKFVLLLRETMTVEPYSIGKKAIKGLLTFGGGTYFSEKGIQDSTWLGNSGDKFDKWNTSKPISFRNLSDKDQDLLFRTLTFINDYATTMKNEKPKEDPNSIDSIEARIKAIKGE